MAAARLQMRKLKELLRLTLECGLGHRQIERALGVSVGVVSKYCTLAGSAKLEWPAIAGLDDTQIEALLRPQAIAATPAARIDPDYARIHRELKRKGVTLMLLWHEYREAHPEQQKWPRKTEQRYKWKLRAQCRTESGLAMRSF